MTSNSVDREKHVDPVDGSSLPVFDLGPYLDSTTTLNITLDGNVLELCENIASCLKETSCLVVRDPRVDAAANDRFLNTMEEYFARPLEEKLEDARPDLAYQVGITPEGVERPRCLNDESMKEVISSFSEEDAPHTPCGADPKWRYFWRLGERPTATRFQELNADPVIPKGFDNWEAIMDEWGNHMLSTVRTVSEMIAIGCGLERDVFVQRMHLGPHLLAPTGTDLEKHGIEEGVVFAGFHNDLNFLTVHGKSRFPGLFIWLRDGTRIPVRIPDGCLLIQAGKQMEWMTGGCIKAGYHEVICTKETIAAKEAAMKEDKSTWRVSSTVFSQLASDEVLRPLPCFAQSDPDIDKKYPPIAVGQFVESELKYINLMKKG